MEEPNETQPQHDGWSWAVVEIFGHRRHAGRIREEERFGAKMLRIDVPIKGDPAAGWMTHWYGGAAIFCITPTDEASAMAANKPYEPGRAFFQLEAGDEFDEAGDEQDGNGAYGEELLAVSL